LLADNFAPFVTTAFSAADAGRELSLWTAWTGVTSIFPAIPGGFSVELTAFYLSTRFREWVFALLVKDVLLRRMQ
jgi:hypothetical protein